MGKSRTHRALPSLIRSQHPWQRGQTRYVSRRSRCSSSSWDRMTWLVTRNSGSSSQASIHSKSMRRVPPAGSWVFPAFCEESGMGQYLLESPYSQYDTLTSILAKSPFFFCKADYPERNLEPFDKSPIRPQAV